jgi:hypothetical protein
MPLECDALGIPVLLRGERVLRRAGVRRRNCEQQGENESSLG